jgi:hypothetical protein
LTTEGISQERLAEIQHALASGWQDVDCTTAEMRELIRGYVPPRPSIKFAFEYPFRTKSLTNRRSNRWDLTNIKRREAAALATAWLCAGKPIPKFPCEVTFVRIAPKVLDDDNLTSCVKHARDELCRCFGLTIARGGGPRGMKQLQARDEGTEIRWRYEQEKSPKPKYYGVRVEVREL